MLRALGIPSRITVGFMTVDRSNKNKGWYWYYADQAHAWVQVYFPGYGWLDFDTTVGNSDAEESPKPDGTPPMQPPRAWLAADGIVVNVDTLKKLMLMNVSNFVFHDKEYKPAKPVEVNMDLKIATIRKDSIEVPIANLRKGDEVTAVSYAEAFKTMNPIPGEKAEALLNRFANPAPIDEVYLKRKDLKKPEDKPKTAEKDKPVTVKEVAWTIAIIGGCILLFLLLIPSLVYAYFRMRHSNAKATGSKAYWAYRTASYYLHQVGITRGTRTPMQYAKDIVDPLFGTSFAGFMNVYLKKKYAKQELTAAEGQYVSTFLLQFISTVKKKLPTGQRLAGFLNPVRTASFFVMPEDED
jgi:hypothetical protein